jgi:hypothetical protein
MANELNIKIVKKTLSLVAKEVVALCGKYAVNVSPDVEKGWLVVHGRVNSDNRDIYNGLKNWEDRERWQDEDDIYAYCEIVDSHGELDLGVVKLARAMAGKDLGETMYVGISIYTDGGMVGLGDLEVMVTNVYDLTKDQELVLFKGKDGAPAIIDSVEVGKFISIFELIAGAKPTVKIEKIDGKPNNYKLIIDIIQGPKGDTGELTAKPEFTVNSVMPQANGGVPVHCRMEMNGQEGEPDAIIILNPEAYNPYGSFVKENTNAVKQSEAVICVGVQNSAQGTKDVLIQNVFILGAYNDVKGRGNNVAIGWGNEVDGEDCVAIGAECVAKGTQAFARGSKCTAIGHSCHAEGEYTEATTPEGFENTENAGASHAEGGYTKATGFYAHAEGVSTTASGANSHAEGSSTEASGIAAHSEGFGTKAKGENSHAEGSITEAVGEGSHSEGSGTEANGEGAHAEGRNTVAKGDHSHAEGEYTTASGNYSHAEGYRSTSVEEGAHAEGYETKAYLYGHSEGRETVANGDYCHAEGKKTVAEGECTHAEGYSTKAYGKYSHAEGRGTEANGENCHSEGILSAAKGDGSHAEGASTVADGDSSHAEGYKTSAQGAYSHAEGENSEASGAGSHAEGKQTVASSSYSHAEGVGCRTSGIGSKASGYQSRANGNYSFAHGDNCETGVNSGDDSTVAEFSTALGKEAKAEHDYAFVYKGGGSTNGSNGDGTFNLHLRRGVDDIYVNGKPLKSVLPANGASAPSKTEYVTLDEIGREAGTRLVVGSDKVVGNPRYVLPQGWVHTFTKRTSPWSELASTINVAFPTYVEDSRTGSADIDPYETLSYYLFTIGEDSYLVNITPQGSNFLLEVVCESPYGYSTLFERTYSSAEEFNGDTIDYMGYDGVVSKASGSNTITVTVISMQYMFDYIPVPIKIRLEKTDEGANGETYNASFRTVIFDAFSGEYWDLESHKGTLHISKNGNVTLESETPNKWDNPKTWLMCSAWGEGDVVDGYWTFNRLMMQGLVEQWSMDSDWLYVDLSGEGEQISLVGGEEIDRRELQVSDLHQEVSIEFAAAEQLDVMLPAIKQDCKVVIMPCDGSGYESFVSIEVDGIQNHRTNQMFDIDTQMANVFDITFATEDLICIEHKGYAVFS